MACWTAADPHFGTDRPETTTLLLALPRAVLGRTAAPDGCAPPRAPPPTPSLLHTTAFHGPGPLTRTDTDGRLDLHGGALTVAAEHGQDKPAT